MTIRERKGECDEKRCIKTNIRIHAEILQRLLPGCDRMRAGIDPVYAAGDFVHAEPDRRLYFADDGGFGADDNGEENVYCIINTDMEVVVPFRPMADVREELRRAALHTHRDNRCRDDNGTSVG